MPACNQVTIERYCEPLTYMRGKPTRGQLHQAVFVGGEEVAELSHPVGSPAPYAKDRFHAERMIRQAAAEGRKIFGTEFQNNDRVVSNGVGVLAVPAGEIGTVVYRWPAEEWKEDMSGWTGRLEWAYAVRWDNKDFNNPGNKPSGCHHEMLESASPSLISDTYQGND